MTTDKPMNDQSNSMWALVELMGHSQIAGKLTETSLAGGAFLRVDVPAHGEFTALTKFFSPSAIYAITPLVEEAAIRIITQYDPKPVSLFQSPRLAEKVTFGDDDESARDLEEAGG